MATYPSLHNGHELALIALSHLQKLPGGGSASSLVSTPHSSVVSQKASKNKASSKRQKIEGAPVAPLNSYMRFCQEQRALHPQMYVSKEGAQRLGEAWAAADPAIKQEYKRKYEADMVMYERQKAQMLLDRPIP